MHVEIIILKQPPLLMTLLLLLISVEYVIYCAGKYLYLAQIYVNISIVIFVAVLRTPLCLLKNILK